MIKKEEEKFNPAEVLIKINKVNENAKQVNLKYFLDLCKYFTRLTGSLGSLVSWGFEGFLFKI